MAELQDGPLLVSPLTAAELGCLVRIGRLRFDEPVVGGLKGPRPSAPRR